MILQALEFEGFRNLNDGTISFCDGMNIFTGDNGAGKTNLLEAIFFSAYGTSFRTNEDKNMIKFDNSYMRVTGISNGIYGSVFYNGTKKFTLNGIEKNRQNEYVGWLPVVVMSSNDIWMVRGAPAKRRNFIDWLLIKLHPVYGMNLNEYKKILRQRNLLLQQKTIDYVLLEVFNEQFVHWANLIYDERKKIIPTLKEKIELRGKDMALGNLSFEYLSSCPDMKLTINGLKNIASEEFKKSETTIGPHRDDFIIKLNGYQAKNFASEGECRLLALLLKLVEAEIIRQIINQEPIYLLDEVLLELDRIHQEYFLKMIGGQIFYATVHCFASIDFHNKKKFVLKRGNIALS
ncbi:MAG: DNA replication and repair protein RecF [candidate division WOR-3 bacterium]